MPAATTKQALVAVTEKEYEKLHKLHTAIDGETAMKKDADDTSIKDTVARRAHWIDLFLGWYADGSVGKEVFFPAEGYKWNELKRYNADLRATQHAIDWNPLCRCSKPHTISSCHPSNRSLTTTSTADQWQGQTTRGHQVDGQRQPGPATTDRQPNTYGQD